MSSANNGNTNDGSINGTNGGGGCTGSAAISEEEFCRLQEQLLELRNRNYELLEENKRQQNFINALPSKGAEALLFASKLVGRKKDKENVNDKLENEIRLLQHKLSSQEEEFRLQQSTLLSELNKVVKQCEVLEEKAKEHSEQIDSKELTGQNRNDIEKLMKKNSDLEMEAASLKGVLTEKDILVAEIKTLNQDLLSAKRTLDEELNTERQRSASLHGELDEVKRKFSEFGKLINEKEDELKAYKEKIAELMGRPASFDKQSQTDTVQDISEYTRNLEEECKRLHEIEKIASEKDALLIERNKLQSTLEMELRTAKAVAMAEKEKQMVEEEAWKQEKLQLHNDLQMLQLQLQELQFSREDERITAAQNFEAIRAALEHKIKEGEEEIKKKDEEMKVALKKQSSMVKELRRQVQSEKKRAEQAEKHLDDVLGMGDANVYPQNGTRIRIGGSPSSALSDRSKMKGGDTEVASSICSWAFVAEPDKNSLHNFDGDESSCSASILEADNAELIGRLAVLQKKHAETVDRLNMIEEENALLRKEVNEKSEVIAHWIRSLPGTNGHSPQVGTSSSPGLRFRRMLEMVRVDESAADIRDMNRRLQRMLEETLSKNLVLQKLDSESEVAASVPGGTNVPETSKKLDVDLDKTASGLRIAGDEGDEEEGCDDEALLSELARRNFTVFVLSEVGKPIFASCGHEEQLCSLIALIQTFVMVVTSWDDSLLRIRSARMQISFAYRSPLILCVVSRNGFQLDTQVDLVYKQMLSIICRAQLVSIFETKGPNFDLRFMLKGTDRHLNAIVRAHRNDIAVFMRSVRVFPMAFSDREQFTNAIVSSVNSVKIKNVVYGLVIANRQLITVVRMKGIALYPCDLHLLINLIECNPSLRHADNWIPICLPQFNDTGFLYAYVSYIWEGSNACLLLLSLERAAFETLRGVKEMIISKLRSSKSRASLQNVLENPSAFDTETNLPSDVWHFTYKNRCSSQVCCSQYSVPFISQDERGKLQKYYKKLYGYSMRTSNLRHLFVTKPECCLLSNVTSNYELHCVLSPFVTRATASAHADRLLKMLKKEESRFFIASSVYF